MGKGTVGASVGRLTSKRRELTRRAYSELRGGKTKSGELKGTSSALTDSGQLGGGRPSTSRA